MSDPAARYQVDHDVSWISSAAFTCDTIGVNPGERFDALIECNNPGVWAFHCHVLPHAEGRMGMLGMVNALIVQP